MQVFDVLMIDPAKEIRRDLLVYLTKNDILGIGVGTIEGALGVLQQTTVRLIVTELMLSIGSFYEKRVSNSLITGIYFIRDIRAGNIDCLVCGFPIIVFTGLASSRSVNEVRQILGAENVFEKPGHADRILERIKEFLMK